jgi:hypothetical protein
MRGAGSAPKDAAFRIWSAALVLIICLAGLLAPAASASQPTTVTVDFSGHGIGPLDPSYSPDIHFTEGTFVGYIQGDEALVGPVTGTATKFTRISAEISPAFQGTADYTVEALSSADRVIGSSTVRVTQDTGDAETGPFGYVTLELGSLSKKASSFRISNSFVRSSFQNTVIDFGVASITLSR